MVDKYCETFIRRHVPSVEAGMIGKAYEDKQNTVLPSITKGASSLSMLHRASPIFKLMNGDLFYHQLPAVLHFCLASPTGPTMALQCTTLNTALPNSSPASLLRLPSDPQRL